MITLNDLSFSYTDEKALFEGISCEIPSKKFLGIVGPNGSGKSTLLKLLLRSISAKSGEITVDKHAITTLSQNDIAKRFSYVGPSNEQVFRFTVLDILRMGRHPHLGPLSILSDLDNALILDHARRCNVADFCDCYFDTLSSGEQQRVMLCRALIQGAPTLLLDEALSHLDLAYSRQMTELLLSYHQDQSVGVIAVSHDIQWVARFCDWVIVMKAGRIVGNGSVSDVFRADLISEVFDVPIEESRQLHFRL